MSQSSFANMGRQPDAQLREAREEIVRAKRTYVTLSGVIGHEFVLNLIDEVLELRNKVCNCWHLGYTSVPMLTFLRGQPWDDRAKNLVHALRPSSVRTSKGELKSDSETWRVTVMLEADGRIRNIMQEVQVGGLGCGENEFPGVKAAEHLRELGEKCW